MRRNRAVDRVTIAVVVLVGTGGVVLGSCTTTTPTPLLRANTVDSTSSTETRAVFSATATPVGSSRTNQPRTSFEEARVAVAKPRRLSTREQSVRIGERRVGWETSQPLKPEKLADNDVIQQIGSDRGGHCALKLGGEVKCWGDNTLGFLGIDDGAKPADEKHPAHPMHVGRNIVDLVTAGRVYAIESSGAVWTWGTLAGASDCRQETLFGGGICPRIPVLIDGLSAITSIGVAVSHPGRNEPHDDAVCARRSDGKVLCWGENCTSGRCGASCELKRKPTVIEGVDDAVGVAVGAEHACAWTSTGALYCWGTTRVAFPVPAPRGLAPAPVGCLDDIEWSVGDDVPVVLSARRVENIPPVMFAEMGRLGDDLVTTDGKLLRRSMAEMNTRKQLTFARVEGIDAVVEVDQEDLATCALTQDDSVYCWGAPYPAKPTKVK